MNVLPGIRAAAKSRLAAAITIVFSLALGFGHLQAVASTPTMTLTAYNSAGVNSGTSQLGRNVTVDATIPGNSSPGVTWSVQGAGAITAAGIYTAPKAMPSNNSVTISAKLNSNTSVTASYTLKLIYTAPAIHWLTPSTVTSGETNSVEVGGLDFTAATTIKVNGIAVPSKFNGSTAVIAQIPVAAGSISAISVVASNPTPGGGSSAPVSAPVKPIVIAVSSYGTDGVDPTSISLGQDVQFASVVSGGNPAISWPVTWSLQGAGSLSSTGLYKSPVGIPSNPNVVVTATLNSNPSIKTSSTLSLLDPTPIINQSLPVEISNAGTTMVTFFGENFTPNTTVQWNTHTVKTTYISPNSVSAAIYLPQGMKGRLYITAQNPPPSGGTSAQFYLPIGNSNYFEATIGTTPGRAIPGDFVGFSHEWGESATYMGTASTGVNNIYRQLVKNLSNPGSPFFIRIGGSSTDLSVEPNPTTVQAFSDLATAMPVKFSLGVNLASSNLKLAQDQASFFTAHMPSGSIASIELGNEPDNYAQNGVRPSTYDFTNYLSEFATWRTGITPHLPAGVKMMGPALTTVWHLTQNQAALEAAEGNNVSIVSAHYYGGYPTNDLTPDYLLKESTVTHDISQFQSQATSAHNNGQSFRVGETNTVDLGGTPGLSDTFSASLWAADVMFAEANVGVDGVNWHGMTGCTYCAFTFGLQPEGGTNTFRLQQVAPLYYGLLFFHDATANSAKFLPVTVTSTSRVNVKVWATIDASGTAHVAILNKDGAFTGNVSIKLPGFGQATAVTMAAPNYKSTAGITIGGQTFDNSFDGNLIGTPMTESYAPTNSVYTIRVQPVSAVLLTLTK